MSTRNVVLSAALFCQVMVAAQAYAQDASAVSGGKEVFGLKCAPCHAAGPADRGRGMLPGTDALRIKYQGKVPAELERRSDLPAPLLQQYLRHGAWSMPPFRKSELSDADIVNIAAYLTESSKTAGKAP